MTSPSDTRTRLLQAAEQLFATEGVGRAQIQAITRLAGQRNASALHYHFGSRSGLLHAVLLKHLEDIDQVRSVAVATLAQQGETADLRALMRALVLPAGIKLASEDGQCYLLILRQCLSDHGYQPLPVEKPPSLIQLFRWIRAALAPLPDAIATERVNFVTSAMACALAERVQSIRSNEPLGLSDEEFLENLAAMLHGALAAG